MFAQVAVDDFVTVRASMFNANQQLSTRSVQQVQHQSVRNYRFQQISLTCEIWFGTRGSEVQILSPRPIISKHLQQQRYLQNRPSGFAPDFTLHLSVPNSINTALLLSHDVRHRLQNRPQCCDGKTKCPTSCKLLITNTRECAHRNVSSHRCAFRSNSEASPKRVSGPRHEGLDGSRITSA